MVFLFLRSVVIVCNRTLDVVKAEHQLLQAGSLDATSSMASACSDFYLPALVSEIAPVDIFIGRIVM